MDPVTTAIITALAEGVVGEALQLGKHALVEAYHALKALLKKKSDPDSDLVHAVDELEAKPDSKARQELLKEEIAASNAAHDPEIVRAAQDLLAQLPHAPAGEQHLQEAIGHLIAQADRGGSATVNAPSQ